MAVKKGLGRGLDMLIPKDGNKKEKDVSVEKKAENTVEEIKDTDKKYDHLVDINKIEPNRNQPRKQFDEDAIDELADSIKQYGVIQPLIVSKKEEYYEIIAGERRWRASKKAGLKEVPVIIRDYDEKEILKISLIENLQREDLNPIEEARAYQRLSEEYHLKQDEIAASVSKSRTAITNTMRLLKLDKKVQKMIIDNLISSGHGRALLPIEDGDLQYKTALMIMDERLSVREAEKLVKKIQLEKEKQKDDEVEEADNPMYEFFEEKIKSIMGTKVRIKNKKNNKGKIEIDYYSKEDLERIVDMLQIINTVN